MKLKKLFSLENLEKNIKNIWSRFPVSVVITLIIATIFFILLNFEDNNSGLSKKLLTANLSLIATFIFSIGTYLSAENTNYGKLKRNLFQIIPIIFGISFYNIFGLDPTIDSIIFAFLSFTGIIAFVYFAPYLKNIKINQTTFYTYFYNISVVILISFIFGGALFGLGYIGITATDSLFDLNINEKNTYGNWAILVLVIITPLFLLGQIPDKKRFLDDKFNGNAFFSFLVKFIGIPFIYLYFFILYAYSIKVLANFGDWPKGEISGLVIGFSIFGYLTYSFSYIFEKDYKAIKFFRKIFPYVVVPQIFMLFYAIYLRIAQYDLTINRYFVVIFGLWLLIVSLHFIFSKKKSLIAIPISLVFFIILISIFPKFNVYNYPVERQFDRLETNLKKAGIIEVTEEMYKYTIAQKIVPLKNYSDISKDLSKNIYSGIKYICDFDNCSKIKELFSKIYLEIEKENKIKWKKNIKEEKEIILKFKDKKECEYNKYGYSKNINCFDKRRLEKLKNEKYKLPNKWKIVNEIAEKIKVKNYSEHGLFDKQVSEINIYGSYDILFPLEIDGYKRIFRILTNDRLNSLKEKVKNKLYGKINIFEEKLDIYENQKIIKTLDLKQVFKEIKERNDKKNDSKIWSQKELTFIINKNYKIIFQTIRIPKNLKDIKEEDDIYYYDIYGVILEK